MVLSTYNKNGVSDAVNEAYLTGVKEKLFGQSSQKTCGCDWQIEAKQTVSNGCCTTLRQRLDNIYAIYESQQLNNIDTAKFIEHAIKQKMPLDMYQLVISINQKTNMPMLIEPLNTPKQQQSNHDEHAQVLYGMVSYVVSNTKPGRVASNISNPYIRVQK
jgi:hypothetical protein